MNFEDFLRAALGSIAKCSSTPIRETIIQLIQPTFSYSDPPEDSRLQKTQDLITKEIEEISGLSLKNIHLLREKQAVLKQLLMEQKILEQTLKKCWSCDAEASLLLHFLTSTGIDINYFPFGKEQALNSSYIICEPDHSLDYEKYLTEFQQYLEDIQSLCQKLVDSFGFDRKVQTMDIQCSYRFTFEPEIVFDYREDQLSLLINIVKTTISPEASSKMEVIDDCHIILFGRYLDETTFKAFLAECAQTFTDAKLDDAHQKEHLSQFLSASP